MNVDVGKGMADVLKGFEALERDTVSMAKETLYDGAGVIADEIKRGYQALPIDQTADGKPRWGTERNPVRGVTERQKADIIAAFGISRHKVDGGTVQATIGADPDGWTQGYFRGGNEVPLSVLLRSLESGTSFMRKEPVVRKAVNRSKKTAVAKMQKTFTQAAIKKLSGR